MSPLDNPSTVSVFLVALGLTATWLVLFYSFTRNARYENEVSQMNRVRCQLKRMFAELRGDE